MALEGNSTETAQSLTITGRVGNLTTTSFVGYATAQSAGGTFYFGYSASSTPMTGAAIQSGVGLTGPGSIANAGADTETTLATFTGVSEGATVYLHVTQNVGGEYSNSLVLTANLPNAVAGDYGSTITSHSLTALRTTMTAPGGTIIRSDGNSTASRYGAWYRDIEGEWLFDDPDAVNIHERNWEWETKGNSCNRAHGPVVGHVWAHSGTYTVTRRAIDGESQLTASIEITVDDPDTVFSGQDTVVVSSAGLFTGKPTDAQQATSISQAISLVSGRTNMRILLKRGESYSGDVDIVETSGSGRRLSIGAWGSAAQPRPKLNNCRMTLETGQTNFDEIMVADLEFVGTYDSTSANPDRSSNALLDIGRNTGGVDNAPLGAYITIYNCKWTESGNTPIAFQNLNNSPVGTAFEHFFISTCDIDWRDYGVQASDSKMSCIVNCRFIHDTGTRTGTTNQKNTNWPYHSPFRLTATYIPDNPDFPNGGIYVGNTDFNVNADWAGTEGNVARPFRIGPRGNGDQLINFDRLRGEGGVWQPYNETLNSNSEVNDNFHVSDRVRYINIEHSQQGWIQDWGGSTWRNHICIVPDKLAGRSTGLGRFFTDAGGDNQAAGAKTRLQEFYSSCFIDMRSDANNAKRDGSSKGAYTIGTYDLNNNSYLGANFGLTPNPDRNSNKVGAGDDGAPVDETDGWTPYWGGEYLQTNPLTPGTQYGADHTATFKPLTSSPAIGTATTKVALIDYEENDRYGPNGVLTGLDRSTPSRGPYEPDLES